MNNHRLTIADLTDGQDKSRGYKKRQLFFGNHEKLAETRIDRRKRSQIFSALEKKGQEMRECELREKLVGQEITDPVLQLFLGGESIAGTAAYFETTIKEVRNTILVAAGER